MKTPLIHLVTCHQDILGEVFHVTRIHPLAVKAVFAGVAVEQEVFDRVLVAPNQLVGTRYTHDDFSDVHILDDRKLQDN